MTLRVTAHLLFFFVSFHFSFTQIVLQCMLCVITFPNMHLFLYHYRVKLSLKTTAVLLGNKGATHKNPRTLRRLQGDLFFFFEGSCPGGDFDFFPWLSGDLQEAERDMKRGRCSRTQLKRNTILRHTIKRISQNQMKASAPLSRIMLLCGTQFSCGAKRNRSKWRLLKREENNS